MAGLTGGRRGPTNIKGPGVKIAPRSWDGLTRYRAFFRGNPGLIYVQSRTNHALMCGAKDVGRKRINAHG
jgi:hypothetical protein